MELARIDRLNFEEFLYIISNKIKEDDSELVSTIKDIFMYMPYKSWIISEFIISLVKQNTEYKDVIVNTIQELMTMNNVESVVSVQLFCKVLGFNIKGYVNVRVVENDFFKDKTESDLYKLISNSGDKAVFELTEKINEYLNSLEIFITEIKQRVEGISAFNIDKLDEVHFFKIIMIIKYFNFDINLCLQELESISLETEQLIAILYLIGKIEDAYLIILILRIFDNISDFDIISSYLQLMDKRFRDKLFPFLYERFINRKNQRGEELRKSVFKELENIQKLKELIDEKTVYEMYKYCGKDNLVVFLPEYKEITDSEDIQPIMKENFHFVDDKEVSYRNFCLLGSPTISHFLSYLEVYKNEMRMNDEEQQLFLKIFNEIFAKKHSFKRIVLEKMVKFGFIKSEYVNK